MTTHITNVCHWESFRKSAISLAPRADKHTIIRSALHLLDFGPTKIAREFSLNPQTVASVLHGRARSFAVESAVAEILGVSVDAIFGAIKRPRRKTLMAKVQYPEGKETMGDR